MTAAPHRPTTSFSQHATLTTPPPHDAHSNINTHTDNSYFKDTSQRAQLERLTRRRQWYSRQQEVARLHGAGGAPGAPAAGGGKAALAGRQAPRPQGRHHHRKQLAG